ncbi:MAG: imidazole glycerol phosphate synthase subunit HisH [Lachnospiraceae bacterium]|nr:imidazole glycerol phosphate synthase subunit HisH [Lachnospiraceae bacterium]
MSYVAIVDYGAGNIKSVEKALNRLGADTLVTDSPKDISKASRVILPGVGAFGDAMERLDRQGLSDIIREVCSSDTPFLGICLGLQLLYGTSDESPGAKGLGILKGSIRKLPDSELKVPHIGWNSLELSGDGRLFKGVPDGSFVYFVHSYYLTSEDSGAVKARTVYGEVIDASVEYGNVFACQFHPEKSSEQGLLMLENFLRI